MERKGPAQAGIPCLELITHSRTDSLYDEVAHILLKREHTRQQLWSFSLNSCPTLHSTIESLLHTYFRA